MWMPPMMPHGFVRAQRGDELQLININTISTHQATGGLGRSRLWRQLQYIGPYISKGSAKALRVMLT